MVSLQDMSINISSFLEFIKKGNTQNFYLISDYYKEHEHKMVRIKMASCTSHPIHSSNYSDNVDNPTALLFLVALFYEKGEISTATSLLKSIHK